MRILAEFESGPCYPPSGTSRRASDRLQSATKASAREFKGATVTIDITDISTDGCGFETRWPFAIGARLWLALPGLEPWAATVIWCGQGRGGAQFARPLHPCVVDRYAL
jgi:hypothetical protein